MENRLSLNQAHSRMTLQLLALGVVMILAAAFFLMRTSRVTPPVSVQSFVPAQAEKIDGKNCPTEKPCGATAPYCRDYSAPSTKGAKLIGSLPYKIKSSGRYYLDSDLESAGVGIAVMANHVDVNLNGHKITYGGARIGSGPSQVGEYGILLCNTGNLADEGLDASYGSNDYCVNGGLSASDVTVENGSIVESPSASSYYDPLNCPGSGVNNGCGHPHDSIASHAVNFWYSKGVTVRHLSISVETVDAEGIRFGRLMPGAGYDIECNTVSDKVVQVNHRSEAVAAISGAGNSAGTSPITVQYNTIVGSPQDGISLANGNGSNEPSGTTVAYNDINIGYFQGPPLQTQYQMYSNDYAIMACITHGTIAYNYVHNTAGRGLGCVYGRDQDGTTIRNNYVSTGEGADNAEYGPNGTTPGAVWAGACDFSGTRGFEAKDTMGFTLANNTFLIDASTCGGPAIELAELPCISISGCPAVASQPIAIRDNIERVLNNSGSASLATPNYVTCIDLQTVQGNFSNYFSPILRDTCSSDGDYVNSEAYAPGDHFSFFESSYSLGSHPLSSGCGLVPSASCGHMMHWQGVSGSSIPDELGYAFRDVKAGAGADVGFSGAATSGTPVARGAVVQWTYSPTVKDSAEKPIPGATVSAVSPYGTKEECRTDSSGTCTLLITQEVVTSQPGDATLSRQTVRDFAITITASSCASLNVHLAITQPTTVTHTLSCR